MITVAHLINNIVQSGPVIVMRDIIRHMDRDKFHPIVICLRHEEKEDPIVKELRAIDVKCIYLNYSLLSLELQTGRIARKVLSVLRNEKAHILHSHGYHPDLIASHLSRNITSLSTLHNISKDDFTFLKGNLLGSYMNFRYLRSLSKIGHYVAISRAVADYYASHVNKAKERIRIIHNGVDLSFFQIPDEDHQKQLRHRLGLPVSGKIFLVVGRLFSRKDPLIIIRAFKFLLESQKLSGDFYLFFLGDGPLSDACQKEIGDMTHNIRLLGFQKNVHEYMMAADYAITASHSEGFGLNYLEAIACGKPVVATDLPPFREICGTGFQDNELFFSVGNQKELEDCILKSLGHTFNPQKVSDIRHHFSAETMSVQYQNYYTELSTPLK